MRKLIAFLLSVTAIVACTSPGNDSFVLIDRLDIAIFDYSSMPKHSRDSVNATFGTEIKALQFLYSDSSSTDSFLLALSTSSAYKIFVPEIERSFPNLDSLQRDLGEIKDRFSALLPDVKFPHCAAIVSPFRQSVFKVDSILLIGMNHYLGENHAAYDGFESFERATKQSRRVPFEVASAIIADNYPYTSAAESTVLSRLLYVGACLVATEKTIPDFSVKTALGWSDEQLKWAEVNEKNAWNALIERNMLFSTDQQIADRMTLPSPSTAILHRDSPGQMGSYIGYKIVKSYVNEYPQTKLTDLLSPTFYNDINTLSNAKYAP